MKESHGHLHTIYKMKRMLLFLAISLFTLSGDAQNQDSIVFSVHYIAHFKLYAESKNEIEEEKVLDIGNTSSCFYGRWQRKRDAILDSVITAGGDYNQAMSLMMNYPIARQFYSIYNNYPSIGKCTVTDQLIKRFYYEEDIETIDWTILEKDTTVLNYICKMAVCDYRNHKWTVCYTPELPVGWGPWKLHGLPGLILSAWDDTGIFSFEGIEIRKNGAILYPPNTNNNIKCSREEIRAMQREMMRDPEGFAKRFGAIGKGMDANGKPIIYKKRTALFLDE